MMPDLATTTAMLKACEVRFAFLRQLGVEEGVARDRTWDAYECAYENKTSHCFDDRDHTFENQLRTIRERMKHHESFQL